MIVLTDSMAGTFDSGSLLICTSANAEDIKVGDIICFYDPASSNSTTTVTHRVQEVKTDSQGNISFVTKGDANNAADENEVPASKLIGVYKFHIAGLGSLALFMQTTPGLIIFIVLPILLLVIYDIIRRRLYDKRKDAEANALLEELHDLRTQQGAAPYAQGAPYVPQGGAQQAVPQAAPYAPQGSPAQHSGAPQPAPAGKTG